MKASAALVTGLVALLTATAAEARATFDAAAGALVLPRDALATFDFESPDALVGAELVAWNNGGGGFYEKLDRTPIRAASDVAGRLTTAADAVEGQRALRLGDDGAGFAITDPALLGRLPGARFEVSLWARADGAPPQLHVVYDQDPANVYAGKAVFAVVRGMRTGRQTSDGWAEYVAGPLDGDVWGVPPRAVLVVPSPAADASASLVVDALEIRLLGGSSTAPTACTQATVDAVCGPERDCMFGHCVSATATWGTLPGSLHRAEIAERWITFSTRMMGDRNGSKNGLTFLTPNARDLAANAPSARQFFGGMSRLVNLLRDNHTSFGSPSNPTSFAPQLYYGSSSVLGACFGVVDKDIAGGGYAYAVFASLPSPLSGTPLQRGDVVFAIDGEDPKTWVDENYPRFATTLPNDPSSDWSTTANDLSRLLTTRASTVTLFRCASSGQCDPASRQLLTIPIGDLAYKVITSPPANPPQPFGCTQRFSESVPVATPPPDNGEDAILTTTGPSGETRVEFDGFVGMTTWPQQMTAVFQGRPKAVLMDARMGHGGYFTTLQTLFDLVRGKSEPIGVFSVGRGTYDYTDPPWLFDRLSSCTGPPAAQDQWACLEANATGFYATSADPPGGATRIAWLNANDVSANDFAPRLLKGRSNAQIFAPHPTAGAFGAISSLPSLTTAWSGGSMQMEDSRFAADFAGGAAARWESSHGVVPDVVVAEKLSDAIAGVDTMLTAATAWLAGP